MKDDQLWRIPASWRWTSLGTVADVVGGGTPSTTAAGNFCPPGAGVAWITPADLSGYYAMRIERGARDLTAKGLDASGAQIMPAGSVLFSSRAPIGYVAIASAPVSTNQGFKSFVLPPDILPEYLYFYLRRSRQIATRLASGTTFKEISGAKAATIPLPLAPRDEQRRIVDATDSLLSRLDGGIATLEAAQARLAAYRASVLKAAVEGRLVPTEAALARAEKRDFEPADVLLKRILSERRRQWEEAELAKLKAAGKPPKDDEWKARYREPARPNTKGLPRLPQGWCWATAEQVARAHRGAICAGPFGTIFKAKDFRPNGIPIIQLRHVKPGQFLSNKMTYMDVGVWTELFRDDYSVFGGELLVTKLGEPPGDCAIYPASAGDSMLTPDIMKLHVDETLAHSRYIMHYINSPVARELAFQNAFGTTRLRLTLPLFRQMPVPIPPRTEQERIIEELDRMLTVADATGLQSARAIKRVGRLRQAVLKWAFEGKLVDQDPDDEPAEKLLERIRAERQRDSSPVAKRKGRRAPSP